MADIFPVQLLIASVAGWLNQRQGEVLEQGSADKVADSSEDVTEDLTEAAKQVRDDSVES